MTADLDRAMAEAILAAPTDEAPLLIYLDCLEERGLCAAEVACVRAALAAGYGRASAERVAFAPGYDGYAHVWLLRGRPGVTADYILLRLLDRYGRAPLTVSRIGRNSRRPGARLGGRVLDRFTASLE